MAESPALFDAPAFARSVRVAIAERGTDQLACAKATGISPATISRICSGRSRPDVENYLRLSKWLSANG